jgi:hypothetical protein
MIPIRPSGRGLLVPGSSGATESTDGARYLSLCGHRWNDVASLDPSQEGATDAASTPKVLDLYVLAAAATYSIVY